VGSETVLIKLVLIICGALIIGTLIYGINLLPVNKLTKILVSVILLVFFAAWTTNQFMGSDFVSNWIITWVKSLIA